jgi:hypothetical protein
VLTEEGVDEMCPMLEYSSQKSLAYLAQTIRISRTKLPKRTSICIARNAGITTERFSAAALILPLLQLLILA